MKAVIQSAGGVASRAQLDSHELVFDQPRSVPGGEDRGPSPLDVLVVAVGACAHYFAAAFLLARNLPNDALEVSVSAEKTRDPIPRIGALTIEVRLPPGIPERYLPALERVVRGCPAYGSLLHPPEVSLTFSADRSAAAE